MLSLGLLLSCLQSPTFAATAVAAEPGFSGFFNIGVSSASAKSNLIADFGDDEIDNINDSPGSKSETFVTPGLSLVYTFDSLSSEVYLGNSLEDFVRFDFSTILGFRQQLDQWHYRNDFAYRSGMQPNPARGRFRGKPQALPEVPEVFFTQRDPAGIDNQRQGKQEQQ